MLQGADARILIVEDQVPVRRLIALWLRRHGFVVLEASHATQGVAQLRRHPHSFGLVIIDVVGTSGLDLAAEMEREHRKTPILFISGYVDSLAVQAIAWRSPDSLLIKPFHERVLVDRVKRLMARAAHANAATGGHPAPAGEPKMELEDGRSQKPVEIGEMGIEPGVAALE